MHLLCVPASVYCCVRLIFLNFYCWLKWIKVLEVRFMYWTAAICTFFLLSMRMIFNNKTVIWKLFVFGDFVPLSFRLSANHLFTHLRSMMLMQKTDEICTFVYSDEAAVRLNVKKKIIWLKIQFTTVLVTANSALLVSYCCLVLIWGGEKPKLPLFN